MVRINAGGADISGVELLARLNLDALSLAASYTHQNVKYKDRVANPARGGYYLQTSSATAIRAINTHLTQSTHFQGSIR